MTSTPQLRPATAADADALADLSQEAFGYPRQEPRSPVREGRSTWVAEVGGRVVASATCHRYASWWWGRALPTAGIAGVKVAPEHRGQGLVARLVRTLTDEARGWGAVVSTLYATAPGAYRSLGYEVVTTHDDETEVPLAALAGITPGRATLRRATPADLPVIVDTYEAWAREHNGPLTRRGPLFPGGEAAFTGGQYTLAQRDGQVTGVMRWARSGEYDQPGNTLEVHDLVAVDDDAAASLLASAASHSSALRRVVVSTSGLDALHLLVPGWEWTVRRSYPYSLTVLDPAAALTSRAYPAWARTRSTLAVGDAVWSVSFADGRATVQPLEGEEPAVRFTPRGFAAVWSGSQFLGAVRQAGLADGEDDLWQLFGGGQVHVRDYF